MDFKFARPLHMIPPLGLRPGFASVGVVWLGGLGGGGGVGDGGVQRGGGYPF